jgi:hypothetical protein
MSLPWDILRRVLEVVHCIPLGAVASSQLRQKPGPSPATRKKGPVREPGLRIGMTSAADAALSCAWNYAARTRWMKSETCRCRASDWCDRSLAARTISSDADLVSEAAYLKPSTLAFTVSVPCAA